jgi:outer membrane protein
MKKIMTLGAVLCFLVMNLSAANPIVLKVNVQSANVESKKMGLGLSLGLGSSSHYGSGLALGGNFSFSFTKNIGVEFSGFRYQTSAKESDDANRLSKGKLATIPLQLSLIGRFPLNPMVVPYVLAGGGYYLNTFDLDANIVSGWSNLGFEADEKVDNAFGFHVGAGLDYFINPNLAVGLNGRYCMVKGKGSWLLRDQVTGEEIKGNLDDLSLNSIILVLSLKYFF